MLVFLFCLITKPYNPGGLGIFMPAFGGSPLADDDPAPLLL